jgi:hypothetical protein
VASYVVTWSYSKLDIVVDSECRCEVTYVVPVDISSLTRLSAYSNKQRVLTTALLAGSERAQSVIFDSKMVEQLASTVMKQVKIF